MTPYLRLARQEPSTSDTADPAAGGDASFMDKYSKEIYIALAVVGVLILSYLLWAGATHRLSYPPFNQKRCADCKKGIAKDKTEDEDYFKNDQEGKKGKGWVCKECQEKREEKMLDRELKDGEEGKGKKVKAKDGKERKKVVKKRAVEDSDSSEGEEERVVRKSVMVDKRKSRPPPLKRKEESEVEYETETEDYDSSDEEDERERRRMKDRTRRERD